MTVEGGKDSYRINFVFKKKKYNFRQDDQVIDGKHPRREENTFIYLFLYYYFFNPQKNLKGVQILFLQKSMN